MQLYTKGLLITLSGVALMSVEAPLIKLSNMSPQSIGFYFGLAVFLTTQLILLKNGTKAWKKAHQVQWQGIIWAGISMGIGNLCFINAVSYTGIANTVLILASAPVVSALIALWLLKEPTPLRIYIAAVIVFIGLYIIFADQTQGVNLKGNLFALGALLCMSSLFIALAKYKNASRVAFASLGGLIVTLTSLPGAYGSYETSGLIWVLIMGIIVTPFSRILIGIGSRYLIPAEMGLLVIAESILAPLWGWWWLGEVPPNTTVIGGAVILAGIGWNAWTQLKSTSKRHRYNV
jgi:drug/metabolite transporter (DMT)-like permease